MYTKEDSRDLERMTHQRWTPPGRKAKAATLDPRVPALWAPPFSLCLLGRFPTAIEVQSQSLIQVGLIQGLTFIQGGYISKVLGP
jgi:hypothetical protein